MAKPMNDTTGEKCVRCGEAGEDRRTIYMACFYAMEELPIPFGESFLFHAEDRSKLCQSAEPTGITLGNGQRLNLIPGRVKTDGDLVPHRFYTLRVCKDCRASWMEAQKNWFGDVSQDEGKRSVGSGIFVRKNGTNVEVTEEEFFRSRSGT